MTKVDWAVGAPRSKGVKRFAPTEHAMDRTRLGWRVEERVERREGAGRLLLSTR